MPIRVMPICTVERNLPGSVASASAHSAPPLPFSAAILSRAGRAETIASSDMENRPLSRMSPAMTRTSVQGNGVTARPLADYRRFAKARYAQRPRKPFVDKRAIHRPFMFTIALSPGIGEACHGAPSRPTTKR
jgi:hypothetical protein